MEFHPGIPLIERAETYHREIAIIDAQGSHTYEKLLTQSQKTASVLLLGQEDLNESRVAFLVPSGFDYVMTQWGIWLAGGVAVPLCDDHPQPELEYTIGNAQVVTLVVHKDFEEKLNPIAKKFNLRLIPVRNLKGGSEKPLPLIDPKRRAMILYTSGTTGKPKGVVTTHETIAAQVQSLVEAWEWQKSDHILHVLPLHHFHGIINALSCALWVGATCEMLPRFEAGTVWRKFISGPFTLFMAVPTIYVKLINYWKEASSENQEIMSASCSKSRLMVSGSAALPVSVFETWKSITHHIFLERYGMTEIGMALSNPLNGERRSRYVGIPLPGVIVRLVDEGGEIISQENTQGEIQVKGNNIFLEYWNNPDATEEAFSNGWFRTGDISIIENGYYRILGRNSVDIIKSGGFKISALEIEEELRNHPAINECSIVGIEDEEWGERVSAAVILKADESLTLEELRNWGKQHLAKYKIPSNLKIVESLPQNVMGKVMKQEVKKLFIF